jgi:hypothetical protein
MGVLKVWDGSAWQAVGGSSDDLDDVCSRGATTTEAIEVGGVTDTSLTASKAVFTDASKNLTSTGIGTSAQQIQGDGSLITTAMALVDTASPSAASSFTISELGADTRYYLSLIITQNTSNGIYSVTFNSDTGSNYMWQIIGSMLTNAIINRSTSATSGFITANVVKSTYTNQIDLKFYGTGNNVLALSNENSFVNAFSTDGTQVTSIGTRYSGSAPLSSITITASAGTMTGTAKLYRMN